MIALPSQLTPSELLCCEDLAEFIGKLIERSRSLRIQGRLLEAERAALNAVNASREAGIYVGEGVALIHLADVCRRMCRLGPALASCQRAHLVFQNNPSRYGYHNEAVATYALGFLHHLLGNDTDAFKWYEESNRLLERAEREWAKVNAPDRKKECSAIRDWVRTLSNHLAVCRPRLNTNFAARVCIPIFPDRDGQKFTIAELGVDTCTMKQGLTIGDEAFQMHPVKGGESVSITPGVDCYALLIPPEALELLDADEGDYAFVVQGEGVDKEWPGVLRKPDGLEFGNFERDEKGNVRFVGPKEPKVIGDKEAGDDFEIGYVAALLRSAPSSPGQSASSSTPPPPPPPSDSSPPPSSWPPPSPGPASPSSSEQAVGSEELYNTILSMAGGDREKADSLMEYERRLKSGQH